MGLFDFLKKPDPETKAKREAAVARQAEIIKAIGKNKVPAFMQERLNNAREGKTPWISTLSPAELLITRSYGIRPIAAVSATCWMQLGSSRYWMNYGSAWTKGHSHGWETALQRLREEAKILGANAVVDVKMRIVSVGMGGDSMDFSLVGTAVKIDGLPPGEEPVIAAVPALEFVKLLEAGIVPTGIAIGASSRSMADWRGATNFLVFQGNTETKTLSDLWKAVRVEAHNKLGKNAVGQGNGVLAHINFSQMFEFEVDKQPKQYLALYIAIGTIVDAEDVADYGRVWKKDAVMPLEFQMVVDMHAGKTPLANTKRHHQSYELNDNEGAL